MRVSQYFLPVTKDNPADAQILSHRYMIRAGYVNQLTCGIYSWLPLGQRVLQKIERIIAVEQDAINAQRIIMPTIQPASLWKESGRYDDYGKEMLRILDRHDRELLYGPTHEEVVTAIVRDHLSSYRQLPIILYQIHWKFRDEIRPRFGVMRGREFLMKDAYSFDRSDEDAVLSYEKMYNCYIRTFHRMGVAVVPVNANSGAIGGNLSHEFHVVASTGESVIYYDKAIDSLPFSKRTMKNLEQYYAAADEKHFTSECSVNDKDLRINCGIEVGHIFCFGSKYSKSMGLQATGVDGRLFYPKMGSYGIGVSRLVGAIIEANHDDKGIIWPEAVAPFFIAIIDAKAGDEKTAEIAQDLYLTLLKGGVEVIFDDRDERAGVKFATMDLIGVPWQIIVGKKAIEEGLVELKYRRTNERVLIAYQDLANFVITGWNAWQERIFKTTTLPMLAPHEHRPLYEFLCPIT